MSSVPGNVSAPLLGWYGAAKQALESGAFADGRARLAAGTEAGSRDAEAYRRWSDLTERAEPMLARAESVAAAIADAVEVARPTARYQVGIDARLLDGLDALVPGVVRDAAAPRLLHLGSA